MKKNVKNFLKVKLLAVLAAAFLISSCSDDISDSSETKTSASPDGKTYLCISGMEISSDRSIAPATTDYAATKLTDIVLKGAVDGGTEENLVSAESYDLINGKLIPLSSAGSWTFTLTAKLNGASFKGMASKDIVLGTTATIAFTLGAVENYGGMSIKMMFTGTSTNASVYKVTAKLMSEDKSTTIEEKNFTSEELTPNSNASTNKTFYVTYSRSASDESTTRLTTGTYYLLFEIYDTRASSTVPLNTSRNFVRVDKGLTTTSALSTLTLNDVYTITYNDNEGELAEGEVKTLNYSRKSEAITLPAMKKEGYAFAGWYESSDFSTDAVTEIESGRTGNLTLYACFIKTLYVSSSGSAENSGFSKEKALNSIDAAVLKIKEINNSSTEWKIAVDGTLTGAQAISGITTSNAKSITIEGLNGVDGTGEPKDGLNGGFSESTPGTALTIGSLDAYSSLPSVTIKNLIITGGYVKGNGGGIIAGKGANLTLSEGTIITGNTAALNGSSGGNGGGLYICQAYFTMEAGSITGNTAVNGAGIYTDSTMGGSGVMGSAVMTGGTISTNTASGNGGGIFLSGSDGFMMTDGTITGNTADKGNGVYVASMGSSTGEHSLILGESAQIAGDNDVYLSDNTGNTYFPNKSIYLAKPLSEKSLVAKITLESYTTGKTVLARTTTPASTANISTECSKFAVTSQTAGIYWAISNTGTLVECNATADTVTTFIQGLTESTTVRLCGEITDELLPNIRDSLRTLSTTRSSIEVELDLSYTTGLTKVSSDAFFKNGSGGCNNLTSVLLPEGVIEIKGSAFNNCQKFASITIPSTVTKLYADAFSQCYQLSSVTLPNGSDTFTLKSGALYSKDETELIMLCDKTSTTVFTVPASVTKIAASAFGYTKISGINFEEGTLLQTIGSSAFYNSYNLESVAIPDGIEKLDDYVFYSCSNLTSVLIPKSVKTIEYCAFACISSLTVKYKGTEAEKAKITIASGAFDSTTIPWEYNATGL